MRKNKKEEAVRLKKEGILIYRKPDTIKGLDEPFEKECRFILKSGVFSITYPELSISSNIISIGLRFGKTLEEVEKNYYEEVQKFESLQYQYKTVILYKVCQSGDYRDGSGEGFTFIYGVFRKIENENSFYKRKYFFERGFNSRGKSNEYAVTSDNKDFKEIEWTQERELFFQSIYLQIQSIYEKLDFFVTNTDFDKLEPIKLLG